MGLRRRSHVVLSALAVAGVLYPLVAQAQLLSPGKLGKSHAALEGIGNCTQCHEPGKRVDGQRCLVCHKALAREVEQGRGLHAARRLGDKLCVACHNDHRGETASLADWGGEQRRFDHRRSGWALEGAHQKLKCEQCHAAARVRDDDLKARLTKAPLATYLGLTTECRACHFDEHRAQLAGGCDSCHDTKAFRPAPDFRHEKSYPLKGAHARVECGRCHPQVPAPEVTVDVLAPKQATTMVRYKGVGEGGCVACHRDVHSGKFGAKCESCHAPDSWRRTRISQGDLGFHDRSRFPLKGKHRLAACDDCHPKKAGGGMVSRGLRFARCTDCHVDAHLGQIKSDAAGGVACEGCHNEDGFYPPRFSVEQHAKTRYSLTGGHLAVPCNRCHKPAVALLEPRVPERLRQRSGAAKGTELINFTRMTMPEMDLARCDSCHADPHAAQFAAAPARACGDCHVVDSFRVLRFDHSRDSRFALVGRHAKAPCAACHESRASSGVVYRGAPSRCAACHRDVHAGQFGVDVDCARCHSFEAFKPASFNHNDPVVSRFPLVGKHAGLACGKCHRPGTRDGGKTTWYVGLPTRCEGCHVNVHAVREGGAP